MYACVACGMWCAEEYVTNGEVLLLPIQAEENDGSTKRNNGTLDTYRP